MLVAPLLTAEEAGLGLKRMVFGIMLIIMFSIGVLTEAFNARFISSASAINQASSIPSTSVFLTPHRIDGIAGQNVTVYANITDVTGLLTYQIGLVWSNATVAECTSVKGGSVLNSIPANDSVEIPGTINNTLGKTTSPYAWSGLGSQHNMNGSGTLAVFTFKMLQTGYADVHVNNAILYYKDGVTIIPFNTIDYFTAVRGRKQYIVRIEGNPSESSSNYAGFYEESVTQMNSTKVGGVPGLTGNMTFAINGTSADNGAFGYFNATIPYNLMNCGGNNTDWIVELNTGTGPVLQPARIVSSGNGTTTTISLSLANFYPLGISATSIVNIYSTNIAAGLPTQSATIYINPDGSITPSTASIATVDKVTYTFTGNNYASIVVERGNIIINGEGYTLQASNGTGFSLTDVSNVTIENTTITNGYYGIDLNSSSGNVLSGNNVIANNYCGICLEDSCDNNTLSNNNVANNGYGATFGYGIYLGYSSDNNVLSRNDIRANRWLAIDIWSSSNNNTILGNNVTANSNGIGLASSSGNALSRNDIAANSGVGISISASSNNVLFGNNLTANSDIDVNIGESSGNVLYANVIADSPFGIWLSSSSNNTLYHNNFVGNAYQVDSSGFENIWDKGYPSGGNYWSDYQTRYPNASEIDNSGIWNMPYVIDSNNIDHYPLMKPYVLPAPSVSISPSSVVLDVGQSQEFTSSVSGDTSPYTYQWYMDSVAVSGATNSTWIYTPNTNGSHTIFVTIKDATGIQAKSNNATVKVNEMLSVNVSPESITLDAGQSYTFNATVLGGTSPYSYQWYLNGTLVSGAINSSWTYRFASAGSNWIYVRVTDSATPTANIVASNDNATITINTAPSVTVSPDSSTLDVNQSRTFTLTVKGGTSPFTYQWYLNGVQVSGANSSSWMFSPASSGSYKICANVTDAIGVRVKSNTALVTVNPLPSLKISPMSSTLDAGQNQTFTATVSGGTSPYSYQWYLDGVLISGVTGSTWTCSSSAPGLHKVYVNATDSVGISANSSIASVTVNSVLSVSIAPDSVTSDLGQFLTFQSIVSGGTSPYSYQWYLNGTLVLHATSPSWTFTPPLGYYTVYVNVTDNVGVQVMSTTASATVNRALTASVSPTSVTLDVRQSRTFTVTVSGGTSPCTYQWYLNNTAILAATGSSWTFTPSSSASYSVYVKITDAANAVVGSNTSVTVNALPFVNVGTAVTAAIIIVIIVVVMAAISLTILRRRERARSKRAL